MKKIIILCTVAVLIIFFISLIQQAGTHVDFRTIRIGFQELGVEIARTEAQISLGLGGRDRLGSDGMLFVMPSRGVPRFWMKGMRFDLDFVWIDGDQVIDTTENVPAQPGVDDALLPTYSPKFPVTHVLELPSGDIKRRQIQIGDKVTY